MVKISDAELVVMNIAWEMKEATSGEIIKECEKMDMKWNSNTVRTLINRLVEKKVLGIVNRIGKAYTFVPLIKESDYKVKRTRQFIKQFFEGSLNDFLTCVWGEYSLSSEEAEELLARINEKLKTM